jgi:hypothetical protein
MATFDPKILEYLRQTGKLPDPTPGTGAEVSSQDLSPPSTDVDLQGLIAAQNADADRRRLMALGAAGERAAAAIGHRTPDLQPFQPVNQEVKNFVLRNELKRKAEEGEMKARAAASEMALKQSREESERALREARVADLQLKPELAEKRFMSEAEKLKSLNDYRAQQVALGKERNQIARSRPVGGGAMSGGGSSFMENYVEGVRKGLLEPPKGRLTGNMLVAQSMLADSGFNVAKANMQWTAEKKFLQSLNAPQPTRLRQATHMVQKSLGEIERLYDDWEKIGLASRFPTLNRKAIQAAIETGGEVGAAAQRLDTMISDIILEQATVLMGGAVPTNEAIKKAEHNLDIAWGGKSFRSGLEAMLFNTNVRLSVMDEAMSNVGGGNREANPYAVISPNAGGPEEKKATHRFNPKTGKIEAIQ